MTRPEAVGPISIPIDKVRLALADSATFRAWVDVTTRLDALDRIYGVVLPAALDRHGEVAVDDLVALRPFCQVEIPDAGMRLQRQSESAGSQEFDLSADVQVTFEQGLPPDWPAADASAAEVDFNNTVGVVTQEVFAMSGVAPYGDIAGALLVKSTFRGNAKLTPTLGDVFAAIVSFQIGPPSG